jgi:hypothetical protein
VTEKTRPDAYLLSDDQGQVLEHSWNAENLHRFFVEIKVVSGGLMNYKRAFVVAVTSRILFQCPYSFSHRGSPQGFEVFNEEEPMYPKAAIKASFPQNYENPWSK